MKVKKNMPHTVVLASASSRKVHFIYATLFL
jgi:hypothetical protein